MNFLLLVLSLPETVSTFLGLALQAELRRLLFFAVGGIVAANLVYLLVRDQDGAHPSRAALWYLCTSVVLVALFWADIFPPARAYLTRVTADDVASYSAAQDGDAVNVTAADMRAYSVGPANTLVSAVRDAPEALVTPGFYWLLKVATETPLELARRINSQTYRPFSALVPMEWLMGLELTADLSRALQDWLEGCYKPSLLTDKEFQDAITARDLLPWGTTPVAQALASRAAIPGAQTGKGYFRRNTPLGLSFLSNPDSPSTVNCLTYLAAVEMDVESMLYTTTSPNGTPLSQIFNEEFGLSANEQARMIINREMRRLMQGPVPAPSLAGTYGATASLAAVTGSLTGALRGGVAGAAGGVLSQADQALQRFLWWLGIATWLVWWLPDIMGVIELLLVGLFPLVFLWMLIPGQQVRALLYYVPTLIWAYSSPLWFALIDLLARAAAARALQLNDPILQLLNWAPQLLSSVQLTIIGLALVPVLVGALLYGVVRGTQTIWRSAVTA